MSVDFPQPEGALITMKRGFVCMAHIVYHNPPPFRHAYLAGRRAFDIWTCGVRHATYATTFRLSTGMYPRRLSSCRLSIALVACRLSLVSPISTILRFCLPAREK